MLLYIPSLRIFGLFQLYLMKVENFNKFPLRQFAGEVIMNYYSNLLPFVFYSPAESYVSVCKVEFTQPLRACVLMKGARKQARGVVMTPAID